MQAQVAVACGGLGVDMVGNVLADLQPLVVHGLLRGVGCVDIEDEVRAVLMKAAQ